MKTPKKVVRDGKVAVLVSPGYGAGWSTWNTQEEEWLLFDEALVEMAERGATGTEVETFLAEQGVQHVYTGGWCDIEVQWVPQGTRFIVEEYDGSESLQQEWALPFHTA